MGRCGQLVMGPAGSGKSTYCGRLNEHMQAVHRRLHVVNLDPAAEQFNYDVRAHARALRAHCTHTCARAQAQGLCAALCAARR